MVKGATVVKEVMEATVQMAPVDQMAPTDHPAHLAQMDLLVQDQTLHQLVHPNQLMALMETNINLVCFYFIF